MLDQTRIRLDAINYVLALRERWAAVPASELASFPSRQRRIFLKGAQGIFKPRELSEPLSLLSTIDSPYTDALFEGRRILYDFLPPVREHDNEGLRRCGESGLPLIYLLQVKGNPRAEYEIFAPVFVAGWDESSRQFLIDLSGQPGEMQFSGSTRRSQMQLDLPKLRTPQSAAEVREIASGYLMTAVQRRLDDARFRQIVLRAYRDRCAVCLLRTRALLEAARLALADAPHMRPSARDGICMCAIHHRAFATGILTIDESGIIHIDLPGRAGAGGQRLLQDYAGRALTLPADESDWPRLLEHFAEDADGVES
ncbi:MAG: hypothetical protein ABI718_07625 [Acidobacteriota bacterium]